MYEEAIACLILFLKDSQKSFRSMHRCPTELFERMHIISHVYHTQKVLGKCFLICKALFYTDERAVCILKRITKAHSSTLYISLCQ
jgi:hypothetical protein